MTKKVKIPFTGLTKKNWINLLLVALATYYVISFAMPFVQGDWCRTIDYCGYYGAGLTMNDGRMADIYDTQVLGQYQFDVFNSANGIERFTEVISMVYLPIFMVPLKFFALFNFQLSLLIWYLINICGLVLYFVFFYRQVSGGKPKWKFLALLVLSYPVLLNFNYGQMNVLLVICAAEFIRSLLMQKPVRARSLAGRVAAQTAAADRRSSLFIGTEEI